jgi:hypothetical protein
VTEQPGLGRQRQSLLTLAQMWEQDREPLRQLAPNLRAIAKSFDRASAHVS